MAIKSLLPGSPTQPKQEVARLPTSIAIQRALSDNFEFSTVLLMGALLQGTALLLIPRIWVLLPTFVVLVSRFAKTMAITFKLIPNPQLKGVIYPRTTAVIPDREGEFNEEGHATKEKVAVLILGLRINHPLGFLAPQLKEMGSYTQKMFNELDEKCPDNGFMGQTNWSSKSELGSYDTLLISYWRSTEDILKFAYGPSHRATWNWWESKAAELKHIGISHEIYESDKGEYENVFINFQPTRIGATTFLRKGDQMIGGTVPDQWISPIVDASRGKFRTSKGRLGWSTEAEKEALSEKQGLH